MPTKIQFRRGTYSQWANANPVLSEGELGVELDTNQFKVGDGSTAWNSLAYGGIQGPAGQKYITFNMPGTTVGPYQGTSKFFPPFNSTIQYVISNVSATPVDTAVVFQVTKNGTSVGTVTIPIDSYTSANTAITTSLTTADYLGIYLVSGTATDLVVNIGYN